MTARGARLWRRIEDELLEVDAQVLGTLSSAEREAVIRAMTLLSRATDRWRAAKSAQRA